MHRSAQTLLSTRPRGEGVLSIESLLGRPYHPVSLIEQNVVLSNEKTGQFSLSADVMETTLQQEVLLWLHKRP